MPESGQGTTPIKPHMVRGHFKQQPYGPGSMQRKLIWIAPYWRCEDDFGKRIERRYILGVWESSTLP